MRTLHVILLLLLLSVTPAIAANKPALESAFSPKQGATKLVVKTIKDAKKSVQVAAYSFTSEPIAEALVAAYEKGINVKVVLDKSHRKGRGSLYKYLQENNVPTRINSKYAIMHNKFMIIDGKILEIGSFNYTSLDFFRSEVGWETRTRT
jgi:phosphatidylserine/phosphatidylglycerophosphate/cardiolipin synthase-like enzyme